MAARALSHLPSISVLCLTTLVVACNHRGCEENAQQTASGLPGNDRVLATVEKTAITEFDVLSAAEAALGQTDEPSEDARAKVLDTLITQRAIALRAEPELTPLDRSKLDKKLAHFREQLLVEKYLLDHYPPKPIREDMIRDFYTKNEALFGATDLPHFELLRTPVLQEAPQKAGWLAKLGEATAASDFAALAKASGGELEYARGVADDAALHPRIRHALASLTVGQKSEVFVVDGRALVLHVTEVTRRSPRPLSEVKDSIQRTLAARAVKESLARAGEQARKQLQVTRSP